MKSILSAFTVIMFAVSLSFAQESERIEDAQSNDVYTQDDTYQGTNQDNMNQEGMQNQDAQNQIGQNTSDQAEDKTQIAKEELPSEVSNKLEEGKYSDWTVAEAYKVNGQNGKEKYEVHFDTPQGETEKETFNESGEIAR